MKKWNAGLIMFALLLSLFGGAFAAGPAQAAPSYPSVYNIMRRAAEAATTDASVDFLVTFNTPVTGINETDFQLGGLGLKGVSVTSVSPSSGPASSYTVTVSTGEGVGPLTLVLIDDDTIIDANGNPLGGASDGSFMNGEPYTVNRPVTGLPATQLVSGDYHSCLLRDSAVKCWGYNEYGQLGDGTNSYSNVPVDVSGLSGVTALVAGSNHTCALLSDGGMKCWGQNESGQLGDGTTTDSFLPVSVVGTGGTGTLAGVSGMSAGGHFTCALISTGVKCWGANSDDTLGTGDHTDSSTPVSVLDQAGTAPLTDITQISSGYSFTCALNTSGALQCWGNGTYGSLGDGNLNNSPLPVAVNSSEVFGSVQAGLNHACALSTAGSVYCWGSNDSGQAGTAPAADKVLSPLLVSGLENHVSSIDMGGYHSCAILNDDTLECWGANMYGQLGDFPTSNSDTPLAITDLSAYTKLASPALGVYHTCVIGDTAILCWGNNSVYQLGDGSYSEEDSATPLVVYDPPLVKSITRAGGSSTIAGTSADFTVKFNWAVSGVDVSDFQLGGLGLKGVSVTSVSPSSGPASSYTVTVNTGEGVGPLTLALIDDDSITNVYGNTPGYANDGSFKNGESYTVNRPVTGLPATQLVNGGLHSCILRDGGVKCWGYNLYGQLGDGTNTDSNIPVDVPGLSGVTALVAGTYHTCALLSDGGMKCWGQNSFGQLGDGTTTDSNVPVSVVGADGTGTLAGVSGMSAGEYFTCALISAAVECWGSNSSMQLGSVDLTNSLTPVSILDQAGTAPLTDITQISSGGEFTCALNTSGVLQCWGVGYQGQLGDGNAASSSKPVAVNSSEVFGFVDAGGLHVCALSTAGGVFCWGLNDSGQAGSNLQSPYPYYSSPVPAIGLDKQVSSISMGGSQSCAVLNDDTLKCWGDNTVGQLGDGTTTSSNTPLAITSLSSSTKLTSPAVGFGHTCIIVDSAILCWGNNFFSQLGDKTNTDSTTPVVVYDPPLVKSITRAGGSSTIAGTSASYTVSFSWAVSGVDVSDFQLGGFGLKGVSVTSVSPSSGPASSYTVTVNTGDGVGPLTLALLDDDSITNGYDNSLAYGNDGSFKNGEFYTVNRPVTGLPATQLVSGGLHSCMLRDGGVKCWGFNLYGQLGDGTTTSRNIPVDVPGLSNVTALVAGTFHTCALLSDGGMKCWGKNESGQLGDNTTNDRTSPVSVKGAGGTGTLAGVNAISAGEKFTCALISAAVKCWGANGSSQLGTGNTTASLTPLSVKDQAGTGTLADITQISSGNEFTCALNTSGVLQCWGMGTNGALGDGNATTSSLPVAVNSSEYFVNVQAGGLHTCALSTAGSVFCWGKNNKGQAGTDSIIDPTVNSPKLVTGLNKLVSSIDMGSNHSCAILNDDTLKCWGEGTYGQLGDGTVNNSYSPLAITSLSSYTKFTSAALGFSHSCVIANTAILCWGNNATGQLGNATNTNTLTPVIVQLQPGSFTLTSPTEGTTVSSGPTLQWGSSTRATSYEYCYDTTNDNACSSWVSNSTSTSKTLSGLSNGTFYWLVRAKNADGTTYAGGSSTSFRSFIYKSPTPGGFSMASPISGMHVNASPTLSWGTATGANSYEYCYDKTNDNACSPFVNNNTATSKSLNGLSAGTYYWMVRAKNSYGYTYADGSSTAYQSFLVDLTKPTVQSITRVDSNPSEALTVHFLVTFSESVTGVTKSNFRLTAVGVEDAAVTNVVVATLAPAAIVASDTYRVTVSTGSKSGTLRLDLGTIGNIRDVAGNALAATFNSGQKYTMDRNAWLTASPDRSGWVLESAENGNRGGAVNQGNVRYLQVGDDQLNRQYRSILSFGTGSIPDNAVILNVTLRVKLKETIGINPLTSFGGLKVDIKKGSFGSSMFMDIQDFEGPADEASVGALVAEDGKPGWYIMTLKEEQFKLINRSGVTDFRLRFKIDDNNNNKIDLARFFIGDAANGGYPSLTIHYIIP